ncbi:hypothetical protein VTK56DRAFT_5123 [Thermocarpiscus australiensis]
MPNKWYTKHFLPLESNPEVFNELIRLLGASEEIAFEDVFALDEPEFLPRPALALVLILPTTPAYEARKAAAESARVEYTGSGSGEAVIWFKQTINNACGLYAILHALANGEARRFIKPDSILARLLHESIPLPPGDRAQVLENSVELEQAYAAVAVKGDSAVPDSAEDEVDFHYICFARSNVDGCLYELDGDSKGPIACGRVQLGEGSDILIADTISRIKSYIDQEEGNIGFGLMALVHGSR